MSDHYSVERNDQYREQSRKLAELEKTDPILALEEMRALAEKGSINSMLSLGWAYHRGIGTTMDMNQAENWYRLALEKGSKQATLYLGTIYWKLKDYAKAREAFSKGASMEWAPAIYWLGRIYRDGLGVEMQFDKARSCFERASALGSLVAKNALARLLMSGRFGFFNIFKGVYIFLEARRDAVASCIRGDLSERLRH